MKGFLDVLYGYVEAEEITPHLETREYRRATYELEEKWTAFRSKLTAEQDRELEALLNRERSAEELEAQAIFCCGLSIGIGLGRL